MLGQILADRLSGYLLKISKHCSGGGGKASMSLKTLQKLVNWESTVAKAWTEIQAQSLSFLLLAPYETGRVPLISACDSHHYKRQVCGDKCNCLFIQSSATELNGVIPDVHQGCNRDEILAFPNGNHIPLSSLWLSFCHPSWKTVLWSSLQQCISNEIRWFSSEDGVFFHHIHPIDVTWAGPKIS